MDGHNAVDEDMTQTIYSIGDLIWTKVGKYPFWPCMVTYDPFDGSYIKFINAREKKQAVYHVQYFGPSILRGWTNGYSFEFKGEEDFLKRKQTLLDESISGYGNKRYKLLKARYDIPTSTKGKWLIAVKEAEEALKIENITERFETYVFCYEKVKQKNSVSNGEKVKRKSSLSNGTVAQYNESNGTLNESTPKRIRSEPSQRCDVCNMDDAELQCTGICNKFFHKECIGLTTEPSKFLCSECSSDLYSCFACRKYNGTVKECANSKCSKYYHAECLDKYECANKDKHICPLHTCLTCYRENPRNIMAHKGNLMQCILCPVAFHSRESCIAAGSVEQNSSTIICPFHFVGKDRISSKKTCNMNYCSVCNTGGELICCEACPNAFHKDCLQTDIPNEEFICEDCTNKRYLLYNMIVWSKIGHYRWWPARIVHTSHLPENVKKMAHCDGEFAVHFFGTHDYSWAHSGRVFPYVEEHKKCPATRNDKMVKKYQAGLEEASAAFDEYRKTRLSESLLHKRPEAYKPIHVNRTVPPAYILVDFASILTCFCDPTKANPCGSDSQCLNRSMLVECHPDYCPAKDLCQNQKFQKRQYVSTKQIKTTDRGWGLQTLQDVKKGDFIIEYVGEIITHDEYHRRSEDMLANGYSNYYFLWLDSKRMIDAGPMGNNSRFINHSCDPNCEMRKWFVHGDARIGIFALIDIPAGEELTFNYQSDKYEFEQNCFCSSENCRGFIGRTADNHFKPGRMSESKGFSTKTPSSKTSVSSNQVQSNKKGNKTILNSRKCSPLPCSSNSNTTATTSNYSTAINNCLPSTSSSMNNSQVQSNKKGNKTILNSRKFSPLPCSSNSTTTATTSNYSTAINNCLPSTSSSMNNYFSNDDNITVVTISSSDSNNSSPTSVTHTTTTRKYKAALEDISVIPSALRKCLSKIPFHHCYKCRSPRRERLLLCDSRACNRMYHVKCLNLPQIPLESFYCQSHYCAQCPERSSIVCTHCSTAFCEICWPVGDVPEKFTCKRCKDRFHL